MTDSILDKIIASKEDQAKQNFDPAEVVAVLLKQLSIKEADVLQRRYGLNGAAQETLEAIGSSYQVTRERVRQIENLAIKKMKNALDFGQLLKPLEHVITTVLQDSGGIMGHDHLLDELFPGKRSSSNDQATSFVINELMTQRFDEVGPNQEFLLSWQLKTVDLAFVRATLAKLIELIQQADQPLDLATLYQRLHDTPYFAEHADWINQTVILSYLEASFTLERNPFDEYGLRVWGSIVPKRMNDKIFLILKKIGKPMHFVDIAKKITEVFKKEAYPPTVHNELILNKQYVLVGRGIYALKDWGYQRGVVADVIAAMLQERKVAMTRDQIVAAVLEQRLVKRNTIHLALTNRQRFTRLADGRYTLTA